MDVYELPVDPEPRVDPRGGMSPEQIIEAEIARGLHAIADALREAEIARGLHAIADALRTIAESDMKRPFLGVKRR